METETIETKGETSLFVEVFTTVLPFILLAILAAIIITIVFIVKIIKRYLANGKIAEQKLKMEQTDIQEIKQRLDRMEKIIREDR